MSLVRAPARRHGSERTAGLEVAGTAAALAAAVALSRVPFATRYLLNWDAAQFALGIQSFDVVHHQPHPPGYPGYILLGRALTAIVHDANTALVALSIAGECLAVVLAYGFGRALAGRQAGVVAALTLIASPLYWYYGAAANTYALEPPLVLAAAWLSWLTLRGDRRAAMALACCLAAGGAIRPSTELMMAPLAVWAAVRGTGPRFAAAAGGVALAGTAAWAVPLVMVTGGPTAFLAASGALGSDVTRDTALWRAGLAGLRVTSGAVALGTIWELGAFTVVMAAGALLARSALHRPLMPPGYGGFAAVWIAPPLLVYLFVHIGQVVYVQTFTPALALLAGPAASAIAEALGRRSAAGALVASAVAVNLFTFLQPAPSALAWQLRLHDVRVAETRERVSALRPVAVITDAYAAGSYRMAQFYLPDTPRVAVGRDRAGRVGEIYGPVYSPDGFRTATVPRFASPEGVYVFLDASVVSGLVADPERMQVVKLGDGSRIYVWSGPAPRVEDGMLWLGPRYQDRRGAR